MTNNAYIDTPYFNAMFDLSRRSPGAPRGAVAWDIAAQHECRVPLGAAAVAAQAPGSGLNETSARLATCARMGSEVPPALLVAATGTGLAESSKGLGARRRAVLTQATAFVTTLSQALACVVAALGTHCRAAVHASAVLRGLHTLDAGAGPALERMFGVAAPRVAELVCLLGALETQTRAGFLAVFGSLHAYFDDQEGQDSFSAGAEDGEAARLENVLYMLCTVYRLQRTLATLYTNTIVVLLQDAYSSTALTIPRVSAASLSRLRTIFNLDGNSVMADAMFYQAEAVALAGPEARWAIAEAVEMMQSCVLPGIGQWDDPAAEPVSQAQVQIPTHAPAPIQVQALPQVPVLASAPAPVQDPIQAPIQVPPAPVPAVLCPQPYSIPACRTVKTAAKSTSSSIVAPASVHAKAQRPQFCKMPAYTAAYARGKAQPFATCNIPTPERQYLASLDGYSHKQAALSFASNGSPELAASANQASALANSNGSGNSKKQSFSVHAGILGEELGLTNFKATVAIAAAESRILTALKVPASAVKNGSPQSSVSSGQSAEQSQKVSSSGDIQRSEQPQQEAPVLPQSQLQQEAPLIVEPSASIFQNEGGLDNSSSTTLFPTTSAEQSPTRVVDQKQTTLGGADAGSSNVDTEPETSPTPSFETIAPLDSFSPFDLSPVSGNVHTSTDAGYSLSLAPAPLEPKMERVAVTTPAVESGYDADEMAFFASYDENPGIVFSSGTSLSFVDMDDPLAQCAEKEKRR